MAKATKANNLAKTPPPPRTRKNPKLDSNKVGIVIPVFNTPEHYLKRCIDSVLNQNYSNFELILIDNGCTKQSCKDILYDFAKKDERITILHKEINEYMGSAMNAAIDYFKQSYAFKFKGLENDLARFNVTNENPYDISILKCSSFFKDSKNPKFEAEKITHIAFVDSDDIYSEHLLKDCLGVANGVDIVWFNSDTFYEKEEWRHSINTESPFELLGFMRQKEQIISPKEWLEAAIKEKIPAFWLSWHGVIDFEFLKRINHYYPNQAGHEDNAFGILLFMQAKQIYCLPKTLYTRTMRAGSGSNFGGSFSKEQIPPFLHGILKNLNNDATLTQTFGHHIAYFINYLHIQDFIENNKTYPNIELLQRAFMQFYHTKFLEFLYLNHNMDANKYFAVCFHILLELSKTFKDREPFRNLADFSVNYKNESFYQIQWIRDLLFLENSHIVNLNKTLEQAQGRIQELEAQLRTLM